MHPVLEVRNLAKEFQMHHLGQTLQAFDGISFVLQAGEFLLLRGPNGVGKSTLVNQLYGEEWQWTSEVNDITGKGRHTTTSRELVPLPGTVSQFSCSPRQGLGQLQLSEYLSSWPAGP